MANPIENSNVDNPPTNFPAGRSSLWNSLKKAAENAINLKIVTTIGDVQISGTIANPQVEYRDGTPNTDQTVIVTNINLVEGDISSVIPQKYAGQMDSPIMKYHTEQVAQANAIIDQNVKTITTLLKEVVPLLQGRS